MTTQTRPGQEAVETFRRIDIALRGAGIAIFEIDLQTGKSTVSPTWFELMGYAEGAVIDAQAEWVSRIHPDDLVYVRAADQACIEGRSERSLTDYRIRSLDGSNWIWMRSDAVAAQRDDDGRALRLIGAQTDITGMKEKEVELELSKERFRSALDNAPIGMALVGLDGSWLRVNTALCQLLGYSQEELLATDFQSLTHVSDLDADMELLGQLLAGVKKTYQMEKRYICSDGSILWGSLNVVLMRDQLGAPAYFISQIVDVTEERALAQMKSEFIASVSHELRTPLTSVLGSLDLIAATSLDELPENTSRLITLAQTSGARLRDLINDILEFEGMSNGKISIENSRQSFAELVRRSVGSTQPYADQFDVEYNLNEIDDTLYGEVDPLRFEQVLDNLLSNAAKFSHAGEAVDVFINRSGEMVEIRVADQGTGIPSGFADAVFEPFAQADRSNTRKRGGTGLGLSISKNIVERMGGTIGFSSEEGKGATFWLRFPLDTQ